MAGEERRAHERLPVRYPVRVRVPGELSFDGTVENLGGLGALVSTPDLEAPFDVGDHVLLEVAMPGRKVAVGGVVLRLEQEFSGGDIRRVFAVRFDKPVA
jgi:hypothetical protein